jgi:arylsulfatase A-like enzyme
VVVDRTSDTADRAPGTTSRVDRIIARIFYGMALGAAVGLVQGVLEIVEHEYVVLGYWRSALLVLRDSATGFALAGALAGPVLAGAYALAGKGLAAFAPASLREPSTSSVVGHWLGWSLALLAVIVATLLPLILGDGEVSALWRRAAVALASVALVLAGVRPLLDGQDLPGVRGWLRWPLLLLPLLIGLWVAPPIAGELVVEPANRKNVILIGIDTLRLDHTSLFRTDARGLELTPNLAALARRGVSFRNATSQAPWTLPAFGSVMTGRYPFEHGAYSLESYLPKSELTLAEVLREAGYFTAAIVGHVYVDAERGFGQGMEHFDVRNLLGHEAVTSETVTDAALAILERNRDDPLFLFVHYFDPHYEYRDHSEWNYADDYQGWLRSGPDMDALRRRTEKLGEDDIAHLRNLYDEEVAFTDRQIGRLLAHIEAGPARDTTAVIVVADHGEEFLERGWLGHTTTLHEELVRVPLVLHLPGATRPGSLVDTPVETRALFQTVLAYLGIESRAGPRAAKPLPLVEPSGSEQIGAPVFSSVWLSDVPVQSGKQVRLTSVRVGDWKLIRHHDAGRDSLFDLRSDPLERRDLAKLEVDTGRRLGILLDAWLADMRPGAGATVQPIDEEDRLRLKALGYL